MVSDPTSGVDESPRRNTAQLLNSAVLVLNGNYEPLNVTRVRRAVLLMIIGKAEMIENGRGYIQSATKSLEIPSVIRLGTYVRRPLAPRRLTRREVFNRDRQMCQYCGNTARDLTLDHVLPRSRGGGTSWENVVSACVRCNHRKAGRTPREANMRLLREPAPPSANPYYPFYRFLNMHEEWRKFVPGADDAAETASHVGAAAVGPERN
jgi:5-methylcytosine-specific restriction endonuclease McrA